MSFPVFGRDPTDTIPTIYGWNGQNGWYRLPTEWYLRTKPDLDMEASPNSDFSPPVYRVIYHADGTLVFQDLLLSKQLGLDR